MQEPVDSLQAKVGSGTGRTLDQIDPITFSVILNSFVTVAKEMTTTFEWTAWTAILAQGRDFSCAIYDSRNRQVCMADALPIHTNSQHIVLGEIAKFFEGDLDDGDIIICNDPFHGNTHIGDLVMACPVFYGGEHVFWTVTKGHQLDCGAPVPTSVPAGATDVWTEGLTIPPFKIYEKGKQRRDAISLYLANVRWPDWLYGDLMAQIGSVQIGKKRILELIDRYGIDEIKRYAEEIIAYAYRRTAEEIRALPQGTYFGETWQDSDGQGNTNLHIQATVTIRDDKVYVDFSGSDPQTPGAGNGSYAIMQAAAGIPVLCCVDPSIPHNQGVIDHVVATAPKGSICNAEWPASTALATIVPADIMQDAVWKALTHAVPDRVNSGWGRVASIPMMSGFDNREGYNRPYGVMVFNAASGGGAGNGNDGWPRTLTTAAYGAQKMPSIELTELLYPLHIEQYEFEPDSAGPGQWIGGLGVRMRIRPVGSPIETHCLGDGMANPPHGVLGGKPAIGGGWWVEDATTGKRTFYSGKGHATIGLSEAWETVCTGGGGYGSPLERDVETVRQNARDGIISLRSVLEDYGVALDPETFEVDHEATEKLRAEKKATEVREIVTPNKPGAATWLSQNIREGELYLIDAK